MGPAVVPLVMAGLQIAGSIAQSSAAKKKEKKYQAQVEPFMTPEQILKIVNATTARAGGGLSPSTLQYVTGKVDSGFGTSVSAATRLGADQNDLSNLFSDYSNKILDIGGMNELESMKNFEKYISAQSLLADNKAAEQSSKQGIIRNFLQSASADKISATQNLGSAANAIIAADSANRTMKLFADQPPGNANPLPAPTSFVAPESVSAIPNLSSPGLAGTSSGVTISSPSVSGGVSQGDLQQLMELLRRAGLMKGGLKQN